MTDAYADIEGEARLEHEREAAKHLASAMAHLDDAHTGNYSADSELSSIWVQVNSAQVRLEERLRVRG